MGVHIERVRNLVSRSLILPGARLNVLYEHHPQFGRRAIESQPQLLLDHLEDAVARRHIVPRPGRERGTWALREEIHLVIGGTCNISQLPQKSAACRSAVSVFSWACKIRQHCE
jgi:hypothetical protein